jgi:hypothetical protein
MKNRSAQVFSGEEYGVETAFSRNQEPFHRGKINLAGAFPEEKRIKRRYSHWEICFLPRAMSIFPYEEMLFRVEKLVLLLQTSWLVKSKKRINYCFSPLEMAIAVLYV